MTETLTPAQTGIDRLAADVMVSPSTVTMFKELLTRLPDLIIYRPDPNKSECYPCSRSINHIVDECEIVDVKLSDDGTDIYAWPSTTISGFRVYSDPPYIIIGRVNTAGFGVVPTEKWEEQLEKDEINNKVIRKIRTHLKSRPAIYYM